MFPSAQNYDSETFVNALQRRPKNVWDFQFLFGTIKKAQMNQKGHKFIECNRLQYPKENSAKNRLRNEFQMQHICEGGIHDGQRAKGNLVPPPPQI